MIFLFCRGSAKSLTLPVQKELLTLPIYGFLLS